MPAAAACKGRIAVLALGEGAQEDRESAVKLSGLHGVQALSWTADGKLLTAWTTVLHPLYTCTVPAWCCCMKRSCFALGVAITFSLIRAAVMGPRHAPLLAYMHAHADLHEMMVCRMAWRMCSWPG